MTTQRAPRTLRITRRVFKRRRLFRGWLADSLVPSEKWVTPSWIISQILTLNSRNCVDVSVVAALHTLEETGKKQYQDFVNKILEDRTRSIHDPIKKNYLGQIPARQFEKVDPGKKREGCAQKSVRPNHPTKQLDELPH